MKRTVRTVLLTVAALAILGTAVGAWTGRHLIALLVRGEVVHTSTEAGEERLELWMRKLDGLGVVDAAELEISDRSASLLLQTRTDRGRRPSLPASRRLEAVRRQSGVTMTFERLSDGRHQVRMTRGEPDGDLQTFDLSPTLAGMRLKWLHFENFEDGEPITPPTLLLEGVVDEARTSVAAPRLRYFSSHGLTVMQLGRDGAPVLDISSFTSDGQVVSDESRGLIDAFLDTWSFTSDQTLLSLKQALYGERRPSGEEGR